MDKRILATLALILIFSNAFALELNVQTIPAVITPGTSGKLVFTIITATPVENVELKVKSVDFMSIEDADTRVDVGDILGGAASYALRFSVPDDVKPGTYVLPVTLYYDASGKSYEEQHSVIINIVSEKGLTVRAATDRVYGEREMKVRFTVSNDGAPLYNVKITVPVALGQSTQYLGDLGTGDAKDVYVDLLPLCQSGTYTIPVIISGFSGTAPFAEEFNYSVKCINPRNDIRVDLTMPEDANGGEGNATLTLTNLTSVSVGPVAISISGENLRIGGQTSYYLNALQPQGGIKIPINWQLIKSDEPGTIAVTVITPTGKRTYSFTVMPKIAPEIKVFPSDVKWRDGKLDVTLSVANVGNGTAETVFVSGEANATGNAVIGDLSPGDYDSADVLVNPGKNGADFTVRIQYIFAGKRVERSVRLHVDAPAKSSGVLPAIVAVIIVAAAVWWWRKRR